MPWVKRYEYDSLERNVTGWGVGTMYVLDPDEGHIEIHFTSAELRILAMQALQAMEPGDY